MEFKLEYFCHVFFQNRVCGFLPKPAEVTLRMNIKENRRAYAYFSRVDLKQSNKRDHISRF